MKKFVDLILENKCNWKASPVKIIKIKKKCLQI